jgi:transcriptional regulator with XRE-family HTH domain
MCTLYVLQWGEYRMENNFASVLQMLHRDSGLSVRKFAKKCGISPSSLQRYEYEGVEPSQRVLRRISEKLGYPVSVLIGEDRLVIVSEKQLEKIKGKKGA